MIMLDKLQCIQICPLIVILSNTKRLKIHFKFHINLALKFYNLSCIINNFSSKFLKLKVKNCYAKSSFNHYRYILVFVTGIMYDIGILININEKGGLSTQCFCTFSQ